MGWIGFQLAWIDKMTIKETLNFITEDEGEVNGYFQRDGNFQVTVEDL